MPLEPQDRRLPPRPSVMLSRLVLENFKPYSGVVDIPLRRITLLFGANSGGKSSIIQSLLLLKQTEGDRPGRFSANAPLVLRGDQVDLGAFISMVHGHDLSRAVKIGASLAQVGEPGAAIVLRQMSLDSEMEVVRKEFRVLNQVLHLLPEANGESGERRRAVQSSRQVFFSDEISKFAKDLMRNESLEDLNAVFNGVDWEQCATEPELIGRFERLGTLSVLARDFQRLDGSPLELDRDARDDDYLSSGSRIGRWREGQNYVATAVLESVFKSITRLSRAISRSSYLGPLRAMPERLHVASGEHLDDVGSAGENLVSILAASPRDLRRVNDALVQMKIPYELSIQRLTDRDMVGAIGEVHSLLLRDIRTGVAVAATEVGFGISQVLPVVVECLTPRGTPLIIEQPEIHLHPALQTQLADLFVEASSNGRQIIAETHSEHLILRLQRLVRRRLIAPDEICVLYAGDGQVNRLRLNERGEFIDEWPGGFFDERLEELFGD
jgi:hypothetical protein